MAYVLTGLFFMLVPGTFLGAWNLIALSQPAAPKLSVAWVQAHGHAQIFGWIGTFILGIGFYSIPRATRAGRFSISRGWSCWALWTFGILLRWSAGVWESSWRLTLPLGSALELTAFCIFLATISGHRPEGQSKKLDAWIFVVMAGTLGLLALLLINFATALSLAFSGHTPAIPPITNSRLLTLATWGFLVPFVWGFSARWLPVFLGLKSVREEFLLAVVGANTVAVSLHAAGWTATSMIVLLVAAVGSVAALRVLESSIQPAKTMGVHPSFPYFVRSAYGWLLLSGVLAVAAAFVDRHNGWWGASRHALTVGFISMMVFAIGQRVLPAFAGMKLLFSPRSMLVSLALLTLGCTLRVGGQILAYEGFAQWAWHVLPCSAILEMSAVTLFAVNMVATFLRRPAHLAHTAS